MDEAIDHLQLQQGDRIGHGLALGIEPTAWPPNALDLRCLAKTDCSTWCGSAKNIKPLEPSLATIAVAGSMQKSSGLQASSFSLLKTLKRGNFKWTADDATQLIAWLYDPVQLNRLGFSRGQLGRNRPKGLLRQLERYLTEPAVYRRCRHVQWVCVTSDRDAVIELQRLVRETLFVSWNRDRS